MTEEQEKLLKDWKLELSNQRIQTNNGSHIYIEDAFDFIDELLKAQKAKDIDILISILKPLSPFTADMIREVEHYILNENL